MKPIQLTLGLIAALSLVACGNSSDENAEYDNSAMNTAAPATDAANASATRPDTDFLTTAMTSGTKEVQLGQLAHEKATNAQVKDYAQMLVDDHQQANDNLQQVIAQTGVTVSSNAAQIDQARQRLSELSGAEFDRAYIDMMVSDHQDAIGLLEQKTNGTANAQVQQWASSTLPKLRQHLQRAQQLQASLEPK